MAYHRIRTNFNAATLTHQLHSLSCGSSILEIPLQTDAWLDGWIDRQIYVPY